MSDTKLGVNIDHVATIRNARGESYPDPLRAALNFFTDFFIPIHIKLLKLQKKQVLILSLYI